MLTEKEIVRRKKERERRQENNGNDRDAVKEGRMGCKRYKKKRKKKKRKVLDKHEVRLREQSASRKL